MKLFLIEKIQHSEALKRIQNKYNISRLGPKIDRKIRQRIKKCKMEYCILREGVQGVPKHYPNSMKSLDEFGVENCRMVLIEECPCQNRKQLENKEGEYIENDKSRLNRCIVGRT